MNHIVEEKKIISPIENLNPENKVNLKDTQKNNTKIKIIKINK
jgi:hypothetical protein